MLNSKFAFFLILSAISALVACDNKSSKSFKFQTVEKLNDYSFINSLFEPVLSFQPVSAEEAAKYIKYINNNKKSLHIRGRGHSMNGISLPSIINNETLLLTYKLDYYEVLENGNVRLGAGISMYGAKLFLEELGLGVRVLNDGLLHGPSVGGYVSAGGFGLMSQEFGGFWETVVSMTVVDGRGNIHVIDRDMPEFKWFFGSMGQLALIVDVTIEVDKLEAGSVSTQKGNIPYTLYEEAPVLLHPPGGTFWFTVFAPSSEVAATRIQLENMMSNHPDTLDYLDVYEYEITFKEFNPPMLYPVNESFIAIGIWGSAVDINDVEALNALEDEFHSFIKSEPNLFRYIQTEYLSSKNKLSNYFDEDIKNDFHLVKKKYDPDNLFPNYLSDASN